MSNNAPRHLSPENKNMSLVASSWITPESAPTSNRFTDDVDRFALSFLPAPADEVVVVDERSGVSPSQAVENRLVSLLRGASLPVSHLQVRNLIRTRRDA